MDFNHSFTEAEASSTVNIVAVVAKQDQVEL